MEAKRIEIYIFFTRGLQENCDFKAAERQQNDCS